MADVRLRLFSVGKFVVPEYDPQNCRIFVPTFPSKVSPHTHTKTESGELDNGNPVLQEIPTS